MKRMRDIKIEDFMVQNSNVSIDNNIGNITYECIEEVARVLDVCGVCCGVIGGIWDTKRKLRAEAKNTA